MSVFKTQSSVQQSQLSEQEVEILKRAKQLANEVNTLNCDLIGNITPLDAVAQNLEEMTMLKEFRMSKYNYRMEKIKLLKDRFSKTFH